MYDIIVRFSSFGAQEQVKLLVREEEDVNVPLGL